MNVQVMANQAESPAETGDVAEQPDEVVEVGAEDIAAVAALWSGIPVQQLTADERKVLAGLEELLRQRVIGQDDAVSAISRAVKRSRVGLADPDRPIAAMLFCGPTGVGKTELTKALAACYFGSETAMLRLDMSEYMERHTVSKLIGSPPGYVGYGEGGTLTEAVRRRPFTVVLLDEIEKAHPDIFNILLQIFEDGHLTDSQVLTFIRPHHLHQHHYHYHYHNRRHRGSSPAGKAGVVQEHVDRDDVERGFDGHLQGEEEHRVHDRRRRRLELLRRDEGAGHGGAQGLLPPGTAQPDRRDRHLPFPRKAPGS